MEFHKTKFTILKYSILGTLLIHLSMMYGRFDSETVVYGKSNIKINFVLDDKLIQGDNTHYLVGKTNNCLFFYDEEKDKTTVYPMNRIKEISF